MKDFTKGMIVATVGITALGILSDILVNLGELAKSQIAIKIGENNNKIEALREPTSKTHAIGFAIPTTEEDEYEE